MKILLEFIDGCWPDEHSFIGLSQMLENYFILPPTISNVKDGKIFFTDGRHRMILAHIIGDETIPLIVPKMNKD